MHWQFGDHLTSVSTIYTPGQPNETQRYYPYGTTRTSTGLPTEHGHTGQRLDPTGLYHYQSRPYDPTTGRFTTPDTIIPTPNNPETLNRYTYTNNNPTTWTDPTGHCASSWDIRHWGRAIEECMGKIDSWAEDFFSSTRQSPVAAATIEATGFRDVWRAAIGTDFETGEAISPEARRDALRNVGTTVAIIGVFNRIIKLARAITLFGRHADDAPPGFADAGRTPGGTTWLDDAATSRVPSGWGPGSPNRSGVGTRWTDPANPGNGIRIDQRNPLTSQVAQQVDYVVARHNGVVIGRDGSPNTGGNPGLSRACPHPVG